MIERASREAERAGLAQWCQDEAGPSQAIPQLGASWEPEAQPAGQPHEYERGGTAKLLTWFHPTPGQVRAKGVVSAPMRYCIPGRNAQVLQILAKLPPLPQVIAARSARGTPGVGRTSSCRCHPCGCGWCATRLSGHKNWRLCQ